MQRLSLLAGVAVGLAREFALPLIFVAGFLFGSFMR